MIMQTLCQFSTRVNVSNSPVHNKYTEVGQRVVTSPLLSSASTDSFLRDTISRVAHSVTRQIKQDKRREKQATMDLAWCTNGDTFSMKRFLFTILFTICLLAVFSACVFAQDPVPEAVVDSDQGSLLIFPYYGSSSTNTNINTTINVIGYQTSGTVYVKLVFRASTPGNPYTINICLLPQTNISIDTGAYFPDEFGSVYAIAVTADGFPTQANVLSGTAQIKRLIPLSSTLVEHIIPAFAVKKISAGALSYAPGSSTDALLNFDNVQYEALPTSMFAGTMARQVHTPYVTIAPITDTLVPGAVQTTSFRLGANRAWRNGDLPSTANIGLSTSYGGVGWPFTAGFSAGSPQLRWTTNWGTYTPGSFSGGNFYLKTVDNTDRPFVGYHWHSSITGKGAEALRRRETTPGYTLRVPVYYHTC